MKFHLHKNRKEMAFKNISLSKNRSTVLQFDILSKSYLTGPDFCELILGESRPCIDVLDVEWMSSFKLNFQALKFLLQEFFLSQFSLLVEGKILKRIIFFFFILNLEVIKLIFLIDINYSLFSVCHGCFTLPRSFTQESK